METKIHCECDCLYAESVMSSECRKRYFKILDLQKDNEFYLGICNEHLKLLIDKHIIEDCCNNRYNVDKVSIYEESVKNIIDKYICFPKNYYNSQQNELINRTVSFTICEDIRYTRYLSIKSALLLILENKKYYLEKEVFKEIKKYLENKEIYKKYKTKYKECFLLLRKIKKTYNKERELLINKLFITIYELNIKQYETSKQ
jgi:hypothetical protein